MTSPGLDDSGVIRSDDLPHLVDLLNVVEFPAEVRSDIGDRGSLFLTLKSARLNRDALIEVHSLDLLQK